MIIKCLNTGFVNQLLIQQLWYNWNIEKRYWGYFDSIWGTFWDWNISTRGRSQLGPWSICGCHFSIFAPFRLIIWYCGANWCFFNILVTGYITLCNPLKKAKKKLGQNSHFARFCNLELGLTWTAIRVQYVIGGLFLWVLIISGSNSANHSIKCQKWSELAIFGPKLAIFGYLGGGVVWGMWPVTQANQRSTYLPPKY